MSTSPQWFAEAAESLRPLPASGLPIYRRACGEYTLYYAPGCVCIAAQADTAAFEALIRSGEAGGDVPNAYWAHELRRRAGLALAGPAPFQPECLTLYLSNACNLHCAYCYSDPSPAPSGCLDLPAIAAAADLVAANCRRRSLPLHAVFHGGGEPTLHPELIERALALLEGTAQRHGIGLFRYVATNGVMSEQAAVRLARRFDLVGLSCDGPPSIQNSQRPDRRGQGTAQAVERTARILREEGRPFHVRSTITPAVMHRQAEIAEYICRTLRPVELRFEPVYAGGRTAQCPGAGQAMDFAGGFLRAQAVAQRHHVRLLNSGSRVGSLHGPYCNLFRQVLNLVPGGVATACFRVCDAPHARQLGLVLGAVDAHSGRFALDHPLIRALRRRLAESPAQCRDCFNRYHCTGDCPDRCPLLATGADREEHKPGLRCRALKALSYATIHRTAEGLWALACAERATGGQTGVYGTTAL